MKKMMIFFFSFVAFSSFADCPNEMTVEDREVCFNYEWTDGPYLNGGGHHHMRAHSGKPKASTLEVGFWERGDSSHTALEIDGLKIYPWMIMDNGMEHGSRAETLTYDSSRGVYVVSNLYFSRMMGFWEIRMALIGSGDFNPKIDYAHNFVVDFE